MEKIIETIKNWLADRQATSQENKKHKAFLEAKRRIQVREFEGKCCLSIDNIPVLELKGYEADTLESARKTLQNYLISKSI